MSFSVILDKLTTFQSVRGRREMFASGLQKRWSMCKVKDGSSCLSRSLLVIGVVPDLLPGYYDDPANALS